MSGATRFMLIWLCVAAVLTGFACLGVFAPTALLVTLAVLFGIGLVTFIAWAVAEGWRAWRDLQ